MQATTVRRAGRMRQKNKRVGIKIIFNAENRNAERLYRMGRMQTPSQQITLKKNHSCSAANHQRFDFMAGAASLSRRTISGWPFGVRCSAVLPFCASQCDITNVHHHHQSPAPNQFGNNSQRCMKIQRGSVQIKTRLLKDENACQLNAKTMTVCDNQMRQ